MHNATDDREKPAALALLASERPRNVGWLQAGGRSFGDWGTSRLYGLGPAVRWIGFSDAQRNRWPGKAGGARIGGQRKTAECRVAPGGGAALRGLGNQPALRLGPGLPLRRADQLLAHPADERVDPGGRM